MTYLSFVMFFYSIWDLCFLLVLTARIFFMPVIFAGSLREISETVPCILENCEVKLAICIESNKLSIHSLLNVMMCAFLCGAAACYLMVLRSCTVHFHLIQWNWIHKSNEIEMNKPLLRKLQENKPWQTKQGSISGNHNFKQRMHHMLKKIS